MSQSRSVDAREGLLARWAHERLEVEDELVFSHAKVVVEQVKELLFHERDFSKGEERGVASPVLVLWRRVVQVFGSDDKSSKEDAVTSAVHA